MVKKGYKKVKSRPLFLIQKTHRHQMIFPALFMLALAHTFFMTFVQKIWQKLEQMFKKFEVLRDKNIISTYEPIKC